MKNKVLCILFLFIVVVKGQDDCLLIHGWLNDGTVWNGTGIKNIMQYEKNFIPLQPNLGGTLSALNQSYNLDSYISNNSITNSIAVSYSMGGIITRHYLKEKSQGGMPSGVTSHITIGTPHLGAQLANQRAQAMALLLSTCEAALKPFGWLSEELTGITIHPINVYGENYAYVIMTSLILYEIINYSGGEALDDLEEGSSAVQYINLPNNNYENNIPKVSIAGVEDFPQIYNLAAAGFGITESQMQDVVESLNNFKTLQLVMAYIGYSEDPTPWNREFLEEQLATIAMVLEFPKNWNKLITGEEYGQSDGVVRKESQIYPNFDRHYDAQGANHFQELNHQEVMNRFRDALNYFNIGVPNTINVPFDYPTISEALTMAAPGQIINVLNSQQISSSINIKSGVTLKLNPDIILTFTNSNVKLSVSGTLNATGATFQGSGSSGSWHSITFNSNSAGSLHNCIVKDAQCGIYLPNNSNVSLINSTIQNNSVYGISALTGSTINISGCTIQNNPTGIRVFASNATISNNNILNNQNYGILADNINILSNWYGNTLQGNGNNGLAILLNNSIPYIYDNIISENGHGIVINSTSWINFGNPSNDWRGYNAITCSATPLFKAQNYSLVYMGYDYDGGYNSIFGSELPDMEAVNHSGIYANNNYWGGIPAILADGTSWILPTYPLNEDPVPSCILQNTILSKFTTPIEDFSNTYWQAISEGRKGNIARAKQLLMSLINERYDTKYSPLALLAFHELCKDSTDTIELHNVLNEIYARIKTDPLRPFAVRLLARTNALSNNFEKMVFYNTELIDNYQNSNNELVALYDLVTYYAEIEDDPIKAQSLFTRMLNNYPEEDLTKYAAINLGNNFEKFIKQVQQKRFQKLIT